MVVMVHEGVTGCAALCISNVSHTSKPRAR
jgi:hypothetical protein